MRMVWVTDAGTALLEVCPDPADLATELARVRHQCRRLVDSVSLAQDMTFNATMEMVEHVARQTAWYTPKLLVETGRHREFSTIILAQYLQARIIDASSMVIIAYGEEAVDRLQSLADLYATATSIEFKQTIRHAFKYNKFADNLRHKYDEVYDRTVYQPWHTSQRAESAIEAFINLMDPSQSRYTTG